MLSSLGLPPTLLPATPQATEALLMEHLGGPFREAYMIHNAGNENSNPRSQAVVADFEKGVRELCLHQLKGQVDDSDLDNMATVLQTLLIGYIRLMLTSMLTDTNQASEAALASRTDDLNAVLTIPEPAP